MSDNSTAPTESLLPYAQWTEEALRAVVQDALIHVGKHGLPGDHHFYLTFRTNDQDVHIPDYLRGNESLRDKAVRAPVRRNHDVSRGSPSQEQRRGHVLPRQHSEHTIGHRPF